MDLGPSCGFRQSFCHDDVIKWKYFPRYWPFARGIHRSPVNSPHKGQWRGALMFTLICARINVWVNNRKAGDLRRNRVHYDVIVMRYSMLYCYCDMTLSQDFSQRERIFHFKLRSHQLKRLRQHQIAVVIHGLGPKEMGRSFQYASNFVQRYFTQSERFDPSAWRVTLKIEPQMAAEHNHSECAGDNTTRLGEMLDIVSKYIYIYIYIYKVLILQQITEQIT